MIDLTTVMKVSGAAIGSSIAVVFRPGADTKERLFKRAIIGTILGFVSSPAIIDWFGWDHTPDYWLASATLGGLCGYLFLQFLFSAEFSEAVKRLKRK